MGVEAVRNLMIYVSSLQLPYLKRMCRLAELYVTAECVRSIAYAVCPICGSLYCKLLVYKCLGAFKVVPVVI